MAIVDWPRLAGIAVDEGRYLVSTLRETLSQGSFDSARTDTECPPCAPDSLGIGSIRAHYCATVAQLNHLRKGQFRGEIYPSGVLLERKLAFDIKPPVGAERGVIWGFSDKAARRLREAFIAWEVPGYDLWAATLTTHREHSPDEWRDVTQRFRMSVIRSDWAGLWRVELQKRKTPHLHVAFWLPVGTTLARISDKWLDATGEGNDFAAIEHAVHGRKIPHDESGWAVYLALHDGKHKQAQLGWVGKQWGVWNRRKFRHRSPWRFELSEREHGQFLRVLRHLDRSVREGQKFRREEADRVFLSEEIARGAMPAGLCVRSADRPREKLLHRGNLLRCIEGALVRRVVDAIHSGQIYGGTSA